MVTFKQVLKIFLKNLLAFGIGSFIGIIVLVFYSFAIWLPSESVGLAIIGLLPVILLLCIIGGVLLGGPIGVLFYLLFFKRIFKKK